MSKKSIILSAKPDKVIFADLKNKQSCKDYTNCISGTFQASNSVCSILVANGKVINNSSAHSWLGYPDSCLIYYKDNTFAVKRLLAIPQEEFPLVKWAISGVGLLDMFDPAAEGYTQFIHNGKKYDYSDVLRRTNHTAIGVKNGQIYGLYLENMTGKEVNEYCEKFGMEYAIMLDGGHIAAVNSDAGKENEKQKQSNIIQFVISKNKKVCIDAGHGGTDPGAIGQNDTQEKDITLQISKMIGAALKRCGVEVIQTRDQDKFLSLNDRADLSNKSNADAFVSVHCNAAYNEAVNGAETYAYSVASAGYSLAKVVHNKMIAKNNLINRGVKTANFAVLRNTKTAACLVELGFISNNEEEEVLQDSFWQLKTAETIAQGICEYLGVKWIGKEMYNLKIIDENGKETLHKIEQENRNGTIWVPIRQLTNLLGHKIDYDDYIIIKK